MKGTYHDVVTAYNMSKALLEALITRDDAEAMDFAIYYDIVNSKPEDNLVHYETLRDIMDRAINYIKEKENDKSRKEESKGSEDPR